MLTLTPAAAPTAPLIPRDKVRVGDVIDFFGVPRKVERIVTPSGPTVDSGAVSGDRIALADGGAWQMTLRSPFIPVFREAVA